jgi:hypothetical protein
MKRENVRKKNVGEGTGGERTLPVIGERPKWAR